MLSLKRQDQLVDHSVALAPAPRSVPLRAISTKLYPVMFDRLTGKRDRSSLWMNHAERLMERGRSDFGVSPKATVLPSFAG